MCRRRRRRATDHHRPVANHDHFFDHNDYDSSDDDRLGEELAEMSDELNNSRYINGATMRRDVTADYVEQYLQMRFKRAQGQLLEWLLPEDEFPIAALESRYAAAQIRARYAEHYAADVLRREDRDSLAEMIERLRTARLALMADLRNLILGLADISEIVPQTE